MSAMKINGKVETVLEHINEAMVDGEWPDSLTISRWNTVLLGSLVEESQASHKILTELHSREASQTMARAAGWLNEHKIEALLVGLGTTVATLIGVLT